MEGATVPPRHRTCPDRHPRQAAPKNWVFHVEHPSPPVTRGRGPSGAPSPAPPNLPGPPPRRTPARPPQKTGCSTWNIPASHRREAGQACESRPATTATYHYRHQPTRSTIRRRGAAITTAAPDATRRVHPSLAQPLTMTSGVLEGEKPTGVAKDRVIQTATAPSETPTPSGDNPHAR